MPLAAKAVWDMAGPCSLGAFLGMPLLLSWLVATGIWLRRDRQAPIESTVRFALAALLVGALLVVGTIPFAIETTPGTLNMLNGSYLPVRFGMCFLALSVLAGAMFLQDFLGVLSWVGARASSSFARRGNTYSIVALYGAIGALALFQLKRVIAREDGEASLECLLLGGDFVVGGAIICFSWHAWRSLRKFIVSTFAVIAFGSWALFAGWLGGRWHEGFARHYERRLDTRALTTLSKLESPPRKICVIGYTYYPFFGSRRQFHVCRPLQTRSYGALLDYLCSREVDLVAVAEDPFENGHYRGALAWVNEHPDMFTPVERGGGFSLFAVNRSLLGNEPENRTAAADGVSR